MQSESITQREDLIIRRHILEPGEALRIEYRETGEIESVRAEALPQFVEVRYP